MSWNLPRRITVEEVDIFDERKIANEFNSLFMNKGVNWQVKFQIFNKLQILHKQTRFYHGNKTILDESINVLKNASAVYVKHWSICLIYQSKKGFFQMTQKPWHK